jgi:hypothetical protein
VREEGRRGEVCEGDEGRRRAREAREEGRRGDFIGSIPAE